MPSKIILRQGILYFSAAGGDSAQICHVGDCRILIIFKVTYNDNRRLATRLDHVVSSGNTTCHQWGDLQHLKTRI